MGAYLSEPVKDKEIESGENDLVKYSVAGMQGWRTEMEDAHVAATGMHKNTQVFGVFDGHGGKEVARFVAKHFAEELHKIDAFKKGNMEEALKRMYLGLDELMLTPESQKELAELAGDSREEAEEIEISDLDELPDFLKEAIMASQLTGARAGNQRLQIVSSDSNALDIQSFPIPVKELEDDDDGEDSQEDRTAEPPEASTSDAQSEESNMVQNNKRRKGLGEAQAPGSDAANGVVNKEEGEDSDQERQLLGGGANGTGPSDANGENSAVENEAGVTPLTMTLRRMAQEGAGQEGEGGGSWEEGGGGPLAGCTAVVAAIRGNTLTVANAGDSRCVLSRNGVAIPMSHDHKPTDPKEEARIRKAGGFVSDGRVNGSLNLSRALGDMEYKRTKELPPEEQMVTAMPDVLAIKLQKGDDFLILACDGIWDVLDHQQAVEFVRARLEQGMSPEKICEEMCDHCLADDTEGTGEGCDNMTIMVVILKRFSGTDYSKLGQEV